MKYVSEFIVALSTMVGMLIYLIFSLLGIEHTEDNPSPLFSIIIVSVNLYTIAWILIEEINRKVKKRTHFSLYVIIPAIIIFLYVLEYLFNPEVEKSRFVSHIFLQWGAQCVAPFYVAIFCYRHNRFDILTKNLEVIMLLGTVALALNIQNIVFSGIVQLGGGGGHQEIAYSAAVFICIILTYIFCGLEEYRYKIFTNKFFRYLEMVLIPVLGLIILMSGGRGGSLLMIIGAIACIYMFARKKASFSFLIVIAVVVVGVLAFSRNADRDSMSVFNSGMNRSFNYFSGGSINTSAGDRDNIHRAARESIGASPLIGHGLFGGYADVYKRGEGYSHFFFYDVLIHGGIIYLIIIIPFIFKAYRSAYRLIKFDRSKALLLTYGLYITVMLLFSGTYFMCPQFWLFMTFSLLSQNEAYLLTKKNKIVLYAK